MENLVLRIAQGPAILEDLAQGIVREAISSLPDIPAAAAVPVNNIFHPRQQHLPQGLQGEHAVRSLVGQVASLSSSSRDGPRQLLQGCLQWVPLSK